jgi:hypothetical protein
MPPAANRGAQIAGYQGRHVTGVLLLCWLRSRIFLVRFRMKSEHICSNHPAVQKLPWELIRGPGASPPPDRNRIVVRVVPTIGLDAIQPLPRSEQINVVFAVAEPIDQAALDWNETLVYLQQKSGGRELRRPLHRGHSDHGCNRTRVQYFRPQSLQHARPQTSSTRAPNPHH